MVWFLEEKERAQAAQRSYTPSRGRSSPTRPSGQFGCITARCEPASSDSSMLVVVDSTCYHSHLGPPVQGGASRASHVPWSTVTRLRCVPSFPLPHDSWDSRSQSMAGTTTDELRAHTDHHSGLFVVRRRHYSSKHGSLLTYLLPFHHQHTRPTHHQDVATNQRSLPLVLRRARQHRAAC